MTDAREIIARAAEDKLKFDGFSSYDEMAEHLMQVLTDAGFLSLDKVEVDSLRAEVDSLRFYRSTVEAGLTPLERRIACKLYEEGETGMTAADLSKMLYGFAHPVEQKTVRTLVGRIRRKLAPLGWAVSNPGGGRGRPVGSFTVERVKDARKKR